MGRHRLEERNIIQKITQHIEKRGRTHYPPVYLAWHVRRVGENERSQGKRSLKRRVELGSLGMMEPPTVNASRARQGTRPTKSANEEIRKCNRGMLRLMRHVPTISPSKASNSISVRTSRHFQLRKYTYRILLGRQACSASTA
jgi:hypothetical protein